MRYLLAIFLGCSVVFGFLAYYYHERASSYCELWKNSQANIVFLIKQREKDYADTLQISERNRELEQAVAQDKAFDWNADISHSPVIMRLQAN
jgi:hypothetical protein